MMGTMCPSKGNLLKRNISYHGMSPCRHRGGPGLGEPLEVKKEHLLKVCRPRNGQTSAERDDAGCQDSNIWACGSHDTCMFLP